MNRSSRGDPPFASSEVEMPPVLRAASDPSTGLGVTGVVLFLGLLLTGCSLLFDPNRAPPKACPISASACPAVPNALANCEQQACRYSCASNFVDGNGDLDARESDGCEVSCAAGSLPENPATLSARVGARPGEIEWSFPTAPPAVRYRFCTALVCTDVTSCPAGRCALTTTGHPDNTRVVAKVVALDVCGREGSMASAATVGASPLDTTSPTGWLLEKSCPATVSTVVGGQLAIENPNATCTSSLVAGDELWGDVTIDADLRYSGTPADGLLGGLVFHLNGTGHRMSALTAASTSNGNELSFISQRKNATEKFVAGSIIGAPATGLTHLRLTSSGGVISYSLGPDEQRLVEVLRWSDGFSRTGRLGIGSVGTGRIELTNFRVTTPGTLPSRGATSLSIDFADGGFPSTVRQKLPASLRITACPSFAAAPRCDGGCLPAAGSNCARVERVNLTFPNFVVDLPPGVDVRSPYSLSLRFASAPDAGGIFPTPVTTTQGALLATNTWFLPTRGLLQDYGVVLEPGLWHDARWNFDPDAGTFAVSLDDQPVTLPSAPFPPAGWSNHLGAFSFGEGAAADLYVTDLRISQP